MDKLQRFEFQQSMDSYLESNQVYELMQELFKEVVTHRPDKPLDYLIERLQKPKGMWIVYSYRYSEKGVDSGSIWEQQEGECTCIG